MFLFFVVPIINVMFVCFCCCIVVLVCMFRFSFLFVCCFVVMPSCEGMSHVTGCRGLARVVGPHRVIICSSQSEQTDHMIPWWPAVPAEQGQWRLSFRTNVVCVVFLGLICHGSFVSGQYGQIPKSISERYSQAATPHNSQISAHVAEEAPPCRVLGGTFGYFIQGLLGAIALIGLFFKFHIEKHDNKHVARNFKEWAFDVSKQAIGAATTHVFNIFLAMVMAHIKISKDPSVHPDQCAWYFINFCIDTFLGIALILLLMKGLESLARDCGWKALAESGNYGSSDNPSWLIFFAQLSSFLVITLVVKFVLALMIWPLSRPLGRFGIWLFAPLRQSPDLELVLVMVIAPAALNVVAFWILDNILMKKEVINDPRKRNESRGEQPAYDDLGFDEHAGLIAGYDDFYGDDDVSDINRNGLGANRSATGRASPTYDRSRSVNI